MISGGDILSMHDHRFQLCMSMNGKNSNIGEYDAMVNQVEGDPLEKNDNACLGVLITKSKLVKDENDRLLKKDVLMIVEKIMTYEDNVDCIIDSMLIVEEDKNYFMLNDNRADVRLNIEDEDAKLTKGKEYIW